MQINLEQRALEENSAIMLKHLWDQKATRNCKKNYIIMYCTSHQMMTKTIAAKYGRFSAIIEIVLGQHKFVFEGSSYRRRYNACK